MVKPGLLIERRLIWTTACHHSQKHKYISIKNSERFDGIVVGAYAVNSTIS